MKSIIQVVLIQVILTLTLTIGRKDGDEGRPYEFGFTIDGQQHRHEKKDENGIIQGEFGFITADGVYHVTVYATDENGNFKILSMKNIRISAPLDGSPATGPISPEASKYLKSPKASESPSIQQPSRPPPAPSPQFQRLVEPSPVIAVTPKPQTEFTTKPTIKPACAGCGYVTTAKPTTQPQVQQYSSGGSLQSSTGVNQPPRDVELLSPGFRTDNVGPATDFQHPIIGPASNEYQQQNEQSQNFGNQNINTYTQQQSQDFGNQNNNTYTQQQSQDFGNQNNNTYTQQQSQDFGNQNINIYTQQQTPNVQSISSASIKPSSDLLAPNGNVPSNQYQQQGGQGSYPGDQQGAVYKQQQNQFSQPPSSLNSNVIAPGGKKQVSDVETDYLASLGNQTHQKEYVELLSNIPDKGIIPNLAGRSSQLNSPPAPTEPSKLPPITVSDNSIHVGGSNPQDIPIQDKFPGMVDGLPEGIEGKDVTDILYKFKYTVGFHGHYEKGLRDGTKIGGYFVNGRDGFSRVVTYVADRNGYRPKFKLVNLGLDSPDTPKEDTEKSFGLKSFEFVWYPL